MFNIFWDDILYIFFVSQHVFLSPLPIYTTGPASDRPEKGGERRGVFSSHYVARTTVLLQRKTERENVHFLRTENNIISPKLALFLSQFSGPILVLFFPPVRGGSAPPLLLPLQGQEVQAQGGKGQGDNVRANRREGEYLLRQFFQVHHFPYT